VFDLKTGHVKLNADLEWGPGYTIEKFGLRGDVELWRREDSFDTAYVAFSKICADQHSRNLLVRFVFFKTKLTAAHLYYLLPDEENQLSPRYSLEREQARKQMHVAILAEDTGIKPPYAIENWGWLLTGSDRSTQMIRIQYD
jgi:hypothetical protein